ncbi:protocadherin-16 [Zerene cesonia]|uniref:protocadherin-16 n=1 Tax=Zerene cesonia TaxID=33412 RepID=UPI0018E57B6A|nr:protocadherin-16 [Zerene cesonia]
MSALLWLALVVAAPTAHSQEIEIFLADEDPRSVPPLAAIALSIRSRPIQDSRCYLMNGGAVESFFISEDTPVGSIIGTLSVNGDPSASGDISLSLQERGAALGIAPGSKNLTLLRALDREERLGPASLYVNVRCARRRSADPSFVIPVSVRVWDVNDNAPAWLGAPYAARVPESAPRGARVAAARASDPDQPGPHATVHYELLGPAKEYIDFASELDGTIVIKKPLDYEKFHNLTATLRARDGGQPARAADTTLHVDVLDADDQNPAFSHPHYEALLGDDVEPGAEVETSPGAISARDQDRGIDAPLEFSLSPGAAPLRVARDSGRLFLTAAALHALDALPLTVVLKATQVDNSDRYALATVTIRRRAARTRAEYSARVPEDAPIGTLVLTLTTTPHTQTPLQFYVSERAFLQQFAINAAGELLLRAALDYETAPHYRYRVMVTDGHSNDTASLNITVDDVNEWEPRFRHPLYEFRAELPPRADADADADADLLPVGRLLVHDGDAADTVSISLHGLHASLFEVGRDGALAVRAAARRLNVSALHLVATARDSGAPPRQSSVPVVVHLGGADEAGEAGGAGGGEAARAGGVLATFLVALVLLALCVLVLLLYICAKGSLQSVSAGASTILDSTSSLDVRHDAANGRQSQRPSKSKVAPAPPSPPRAGEGAGAAAGGDPALMSDHLGGGAGRSGVAWPSATIPARVKKLSWDDARPPRPARPAEGSPAVEATNPAVADHMNLTVYF